MKYNIQFVFTGTRHDGTFYLANTGDAVVRVSTTAHQDIAKRFASFEEALAFAKRHTNSEKYNPFSVGTWTVVPAPTRYTTSIKIETTTRVSYGTECVYLKYDVFTAKELPWQWSQLSLDDKYNHVNNYCHWHSGESDISGQNDYWLENNPQEHGNQDEVVIEVVETYRLEEEI